MSRRGAANPDPACEQQEKRFPETEQHKSRTALRGLCAPQKSLRIRQRHRVEEFHVDDPWAFAELIRL
jgi:hypothetical protein